MGDFNDVLDASNEGNSHLCSEFHLTDLMFSLVGRDNFPTWSRGTTRRVDFVLCDEWISQAAVAGCYEPFQYRFHGDHRNMAIDFDIIQLFGNPTHVLAPLASREFTSKDPKSVRTYLEAKHDYLQSHSFAARLKLQEEHFCPLRAESLDRDFQRASSFAARKCRRKPNIPFVRKIASLRQQKNILLRVLAQHRTGMNYDLAITRLAAQGNDFLIPASIPECQCQCRAVNTELRELERDARTHRREEQLSLLRAAQAVGDTALSKTIRNKIIAENTKEMYRKLRNVRGRQQSGFSKIEVPLDPTDHNYKQCREWISVDTPVDTEEKLRNRNQRHFGQAHGTFPTIPPFSEWVDWSASSHAAELILEGKWSTSELSPIQQDMIKYMQRRTELDSIKDTITSAEWSGKIRSWPESTSTSPSGFHLTHSKALISPHDIDSSTVEGEILDHKRDSLLDWQVSLLSTAISNRYVYKRWKTVANVMILKEPGNFKSIDYV